MTWWSTADMATSSERRPRVDADMRASLTIGVAVGVPATVGVAAVLAVFRPLFDTTNAALVLMIVVVAVAALGGRAAGIVTALAAVASFDFFHTEPYLSLAIDSRDDVETTILLLVAAVLVGTIASRGRSARRRAGLGRSEIRRIHRVAEAAVTGASAGRGDRRRPGRAVRAAVAAGGRFEALPIDDGGSCPRIGRNGAIEGVHGAQVRSADDGRGGFELPERRRRAAGAGPRPAHRPVRARPDAWRRRVARSSGSSPWPSPIRWRRCGSRRRPGGEERAR